MKIHSIITVIFALCLILGLTDISYAGDIDIDVSCPLSVASGGQLDVRVRLSNPNSYPVALSGAMTGMIGNPNDNNGLPVVYGPWKDNSIQGSVPPFGNITIVIKITDAVDSFLAGTVAGATVMLLDENGWTIEGGGCAVEVTP